MSELHSLTIVFLGRFPTVHFITKAISIILIDLVCIGLLYKYTEGIKNLFNQSHRINSHECPKGQTHIHTRTFQKNNLSKPDMHRWFKFLLCI